MDLASRTPTIAELFAAAKSNDSEKLISLLGDQRVDWSAYLRKEFIDDLCALETALVHGCTEAANILACYEILGWDYIRDKKPSEIIATKSVWCQCLRNAVYAMRRVKKRNLRALRGSGAHIYAGGSRFQPTSYENPFYKVVKDHYGKLLTVFDSVEQPGAFMAFMRLDDNFRILSPEGYTIPMHILMAKINKDYKLAMIKFIQHFDKQVFEIPSGPEGLIPAVYCLKVNYVMLFNAVVWPKDFSEFRSKDGKDIMSYCTNKQFELIWKDARLKIYTQLAGALNTFLMRNMTARERFRYYDTAVIEAIEKFDKRDQLQEFVDKVQDRAIGAFMAQNGYKSTNLDRHKCDSVSNIETSWKFNFKGDEKRTFEFVNLPSEILEIIMTDLSVQDIMRLFMISKQMHESFERFDSNSLWRAVLKNSKISLPGDIPMQTENLKKYVLNTEEYKRNWRKGKFREKILLEFQDYVRRCTLDDNWLSCHGMRRIKWLNLHTDQQYDMDWPANFMGISHCLLESPPLAPASVAIYSSQGELLYGRLGSTSPMTRFLTADHPLNYETGDIHALSPDRVIIPGRVRVVDLTAKKVIAQIARNEMPKVLPNLFNRSMTVGNNWHSVNIFDENLVVVQSMTGLGIAQNYGMMDEHTLALGTLTREVVLYDVRMLEAQRYQVLLSNVNTMYGVSIDVRNQRMLAETGPYKLAVQMDLKTRQWERIWKPFEQQDLNTYPIINDRYLLIQRSGSYYSTKFHAYDFSA